MLCQNFWHLSQLPFFYLITTKSVATLLHYKLAALRKENWGPGAEVHMVRNHVFINFDTNTFTQVNSFQLQ